jgi:hypothetical protein
MPLLRSPDFTRSSAIKEKPLYVLAVHADCHRARGDRSPIEAALGHSDNTMVFRCYTTSLQLAQILPCEVSPPHFIIEISGIAEIVELETRKPCLATHALGNFGIEPQRAKPGATRLRHRRRHAGEQ